MIFLRFDVLKDVAEYTFWDISLHKYTRRCKRIMNQKLEIRIGKAYKSLKQTRMAQ